MRVNLSEVVQVAIQKPGFFEEAGLLWAKRYHYQAFSSLRGNGCFEWSWFEFPRPKVQNVVDSSTA